jgi:threonine/homoserine/homoserine lactone efflux protein
MFTVSGTIVMAAVALAAGRLGRVLAHGSRSGRWIDRVVGALFLGLGLRLALDRA